MAGEVVRDVPLDPSESKNWPFPKCDSVCFRLSSSFRRFSASSRSCCSLRLKFAVGFDGGKLRRPLKLSCTGAFTPGGFGREFPEPWTESGVFLPDVNGEWDGRNGG
jgi:hypothetical protein